MESHGFSAQKHVSVRSSQITTISWKFCPLSFLTLFSFWVNCLFVPLTLWINVGGKWQVLLVCFPVYLVMGPSDIVFLSLMFSYNHFQRYCMNILVWFFSHFFVLSRTFGLFCCYSIFSIGTLMIHPRVVISADVLFWSS